MGVVFGIVVLVVIVLITWWDWENPDKIDLSLYGLTTNNPKSLIGIVVILLFILKGTVSYGLWFEKK